MCMNHSFCDLIIKIVLKVRKSNNPNPKWRLMIAAVTREQARECGDPKQPKVKEMPSKMAVDKEKLIKLAEDNFTLQKYLKKLRKQGQEKRCMILCRKVEKFSNGCVSERMR